MITIGLCGLTFNSENKGCAALAYSFVELLSSSIEDEISIVIFENIDLGDCNFSDFSNIVAVKNYIYHFKDFFNRGDLIELIKSCDCIYDFTEGDSFTDIYGFKRLISNSYLKFLCERNNKRLIFGPQTIGPFDTLLGERIAKFLLNNAYKCYARDEATSRYVKEITGNECKTFIDVAFALPYHETEKLDDKIHVGINVSGLLWNGGYTGANELGIKVDYHEYLNRVISNYYSDDRYLIHLIPHVLCKDYCSSDNDVKAIDELLLRYPNCVVPQMFNTPMEAKSYISGMDVFTGARMHATIAAFSSKVAVIPFSYSRKFEGLFNTIGYPYCISAREIDTEEAITRTIQYIDDYLTLSKSVCARVNAVNERIRDFKDTIKIDVWDEKKDSGLEIQ